jgi:hypothetical protein
MTAAPRDFILERVPTASPEADQVIMPAIQNHEEVSPIPRNLLHYGNNGNARLIGHIMCTADRQA